MKKDKQPVFMSSLSHLEISQQIRLHPKGEYRYVWDQADLMLQSVFLA